MQRAPQFGISMLELLLVLFLALSAITLTVGYYVGARSDVDSQRTLGYLQRTQATVRSQFSGRLYSELATTNLDLLAPSEIRPANAGVFRISSGLTLTLAADGDHAFSLQLNGPDLANRETCVDLAMGMARLLYRIQISATDVATSEQTPPTQAAVNAACATIDTNQDSQQLRLYSR